MKLSGVVLKPKPEVKNAETEWAQPYWQKKRWLA
jgi:hypothetical protein